MRTQLIVALVLLVVPCIVVFAAEYNDINNVKFVSCYDGDTCTFNLPNVTPLFGREIPVRLFGIDTPEMKGQCEAEIALAKKARDFTVEKLTKAKTIRLVEPQREKYFRVLARVFADDVEIAPLLVKKKYAVEYFGETKEKDWCESTKKFSNKIPQHSYPIFRW